MYKSNHGRTYEHILDDAIIHIVFKLLDIYLVKNSSIQ